MHEINIDALTSEISETYYHKRIKKELREKHLKAEALKKQTETDPLNAFKLADEPISNISKKTKKPILREYDYKDDISISSHTHQKEKDKAEKETQLAIHKAKENLKYNAKEIIKHENRASHEILCRYRRAICAGGVVVSAIGHISDERERGACTFSHCRGLTIAWLV